MTTLPPVAFLGAGSMASAMVTGLLGSDTHLSGPIELTNRSHAAAARWAAEPRVHAVSLERDPDANRAAARRARLVVLAVKPTMVRDVVREIADELSPGSLVVSVAAGVTTGTIEQWLPDTVALVRTMPNTPAAVGRGVTGIAAGRRAGEAELALVETLLAPIGHTVRVPESQIDALSTISGSGPAYVFYLIEQLESAARSLGFDAATSALLVRETFMGSLALLQASGEEPSELRRRVTSPNGTTERAIAVFDAAGLPATFRAATEAALARARELAQS